MSLRPTFLAASVLTLGAAAFAAACSPGGSDDASSTGDTQSSGTDGGSSGQGEGGATTTTGGQGGDTDTVSVTVTTGSSSGGGEGGGCAATSISAELVPVTMMIVFDRSGSMDDDDKWTDATAALTSFVQNPEAAGLGVGLKFFPRDTCDDDTCDIDACATPEVEPAPLLADAAPTDAHEALLVQTIDQEDTAPAGGTPMAAALLGAHEWAQDYLVANADAQVAIVLVTDGEPNGCGDVDDVTAVASLGAAQSVPTYAVGLLGSAESTIDAIASAGGTTTGFFIGGANTEADLLAALLAIQGQQIACELTIPEGDDVDPTKVNVTFTPEGGEEQTIPQVDGAGSCGAAGGWYYDDPEAPTKIILCEATCDDIQGQSGELGLVLGCETVQAPN